MQLFLSGVPNCSLAVVLKDDLVHGLQIRPLVRENRIHFGGYVRRSFLRRHLRHEFSNGAHHRRVAWLECSKHLRTWGLFVPGTPSTGSPWVNAECERSQSASRPRRPSTRRRCSATSGLRATSRASLVIAWLNILWRPATLTTRASLRDCWPWCSTSSVPRIARRLIAPRDRK